MTRFRLEVDELYPWYTLEEDDKYDEAIELTEEEYAEYRKACASFGEWQRRLRVMENEIIRKRKQRRRK